MRVAIIVLVLLAAGLVLYFAAAGGERFRMAGVAGPSADDPGAWSPPRMVAIIDDLVSPFAPRADLGAPQMVVDPGATSTVTAAAARQTIEVAAFEIEGPGALHVNYPCHSGGGACGEDQDICICAPGSVINRHAAGGCPATFLATVTPAGVCGASARSKSSIFLYADSRVLGLTNLSQASVTVKLK